MSSVLHQIGAITAMNLRTLPDRAASSMVVVAGIAGVVGVLVALLAMGEGFEKTLKSTGRADRVIVLRAGSIDEIGSTLELEQAKLMQDLPGVKRDPDGRPLALAETYVLTNAFKRGSRTPSTTVVRGTDADVFRVRPEARIVEGRMFVPGKREIVVGKGAHAEYASLDVGQTVDVRDGPWTVVGIFDSGGDVHDSELWVDARALQDAVRTRYFTTLLLQLGDDRAETFRAFKDQVTQDPRLKVAVQREPDYYASRSTGLKKFITVLTYIISVIMAIGALFGALNTMYSAVSARTVEIATLRALGFGGAPVVTSVMLESLMLSVAGAALGAGLAYVVFNGFRVSAMNIQTYSQVAFAFAVTPRLLLQGMTWAVAIGFVAGLFPAVRAARLPVVDALRAV